MIDRILFEKSIADAIFRGRRKMGFSSMLTLDEAHVRAKQVADTLPQLFENEKVV